tara:strand:+ start:328 stop:513 length:186 start_codon:yes stop_codon:yes gene_type:complete
MQIISPVFKFQAYDDSKAIIRNRFKTNGAAEVALKLPCEFKIPLKRDDKDTMKIYGKVIRP